MIVYFYTVTQANGSKLNIHILAKLFIQMIASRKWEIASMQTAFLFLSGSIYLVLKTY